ncbi:MAG: metal-dependent hydrolase [Ignisphaera sp.]|nr:metal-dependent hydrolase [Ignisphaera sp.]MCX8168423.1 metal-dependent hydrolase [Ignisphaera sp.]MDW8086064.1 metal-dependent hydrolase [Ignisphaera sp.]
MASITWLGHAAFVVELNSKMFLIDPWVTNPLSPYKSIESFVRNYHRIDYIIVTHDHGDHVGESIELLKRYRDAKICAIFELAEYLASQAKAIDRSVPGNIGGPIKLSESITLVFTPAHHSSSKGMPSGVILLSKSFSIYHAGDTGLFSEMALISELYRPTVALLPIGGHFTMGIREAVKAIELLKPQYVVPMHYNTFDVIKADPTELSIMAKEKGLDTMIVILPPGKTYKFQVK